ncbi:MAG: hypothetical protein M0R47_16760 [Methylobacter sp.]|uniref:Rap1a/Tai family immunity protein n=1 Tax=Methylobacter sp. TaxID=2051955 RepID=UPI0025CF5437|nr:Rap1a/Tai family immunity protein [Methylobacter sp.]MCK9622174.1 hypothetical protein [Methylobacter sp.]
MIFKILIGLLLSFQACAYFDSGSVIHEGLLDQDRERAGYKSAYSFGYIIGVIDVIDEVIICMPHGTTKGQLAKIVLNYMEVHPEKWSDPGKYSVINALKDLWPCKNQTKEK